MQVTWYASWSNCRDRLGGLVVIDGPLVFPKFMNNDVSIIRESDFRMFLQSSPVNSGIGM